MSEQDRAKVFVDLANLKMEEIWKRRQITWRTNFVLWAALLAVAAVLYREDGSIPEDSRAWIVVTFVMIFVMHSWHWIGGFVSDEIGRSWMHYYEGHAEAALGIQDVKSPDRPDVNHGWGYHLYSKPGSCKKAHGYVSQVLVTGALITLAFIFLNAKVNETSGLPPDTSVSKDRLSGQNLRIVLEKLPTASQSMKP